MICPFSYVRKNVSSNLLTYLEETRTAPHKSFPRSPNSNKAACVGYIECGDVTTMTELEKIKTHLPGNLSLRNIAPSDNPAAKSSFIGFNLSGNPTIWRRIICNHVKTRSGKGKDHLAKNQLTAIVISGRFLICPVSLFTDHSGWLI